jgi:NAD(P)-dependent dehydrogenase (short-subunit alcohol dehydrogenase family)
MFRTPPKSRVVAAVDAELGGSVVLINNAGIARPQPIEEITEISSFRNACASENLRGRLHMEACSTSDEVD